LPAGVALPEVVVPAGKADPTVDVSAPPTSPVGVSAVSVEASSQAGGQRLTAGGWGCPSASWTGSTSGARAGCWSAFRGSRWARRPYNYALVLNTSQWPPAVCATLVEQALHHKARTLGVAVPT
jgi:hypothetical protein